MEKIREKADVLCIGGGPAGLMAAIRAGELGSSVIVADKSNTLYSGSAGAGNDHFCCYLPEFHGNDPKPILAEYLHHPQTGIRPEFAPIWLEQSGEIVRMWDDWGIPMKYKGKWEFAGHAFPGLPLTHLKYSGGNQKQVLTEQAKKKGCRIINRVTVFELLTDGTGRVTGALGFDTWNDRLIEFQSKAIVLGTGACTRLYPSATPGWLCNTPTSPFTTGDGRAMVYRSGGELRDMENIGQWAGIKYFCRAGKATWIGVLRDPSDKPIGPFVTKPDRIYGDITADCWPTVFDEYNRSGKGPVYMDCRGASEEDIEYMKHWLRHEGNIGVLDSLQEDGIDLLKNAVEFYTYGVSLGGGVSFNTKGETSLTGLYSAGQEYSGDMAFATVVGRICGENASKYSKQSDYAESKLGAEIIKQQMTILDAARNHTSGATWQEANIALQQIMLDYAGLTRSETLLDQGLRNIRRLREKSVNTMLAKNGHEMGRWLETINMVDIGEAVMFCALERKETRGKHRRTDFPFTNPLLTKTLLIRKKDNKATFDWRAKTNG